MQMQNNARNPLPIHQMRHNAVGTSALHLSGAKSGIGAHARIHRKVGKKHKIRTDPLAMEGHGALRLQVRLKGSRERLGQTQLDSTNATGIAFSDDKSHAADT